MLKRLLAIAIMAISTNTLAIQLDGKELTDKPVPCKATELTSNKVFNISCSVVSEWLFLHMGNGVDYPILSSNVRNGGVTGFNDDFKLNMKLFKVEITYWDIKSRVDE